MKTVSLELAKTLKEKGYPQPNHEFWWVKDYPEQSDGENGRYLEHDGNLASESYKSESAIAAPTADEILDLLPDQLEHNPRAGWLITTKNKELKYELGYGTTGGFIDAHMTDKSLADAAAKMWIYLKENELLGVK